MNSLNGPTSPKYTFLIFYSSVINGQMWCPDCRRVESTVKEAFDGPDKPKAIIHWVGDKATWRDPKNEARVQWKISNVPTILRIQNGKEVARLGNDNEIMDSKRFQAFLNP
ncbi:hypothetical protein M231_03064 [Tremella mesenterica]|uniref:Thioredoxin domain-containing protein n=1 Tax=Tremella mesenterica TaxID=5217 RepID=A0A4Q1BP93_TREME|nr:hypothetical protein M231_03064 [Tremella mesenterica]